MEIYRLSWTLSEEIGLELNSEKAKCTLDLKLSWRINTPISSQAIKHVNIELKSTFQELVFLHQHPHFNSTLKRLIAQENLK